MEASRQPGRTRGCMQGRVRSSMDSLTLLGFHDLFRFCILREMGIGRWGCQSLVPEGLHLLWGQISSGVVERPDSMLQIYQTQSGVVCGLRLLEMGWRSFENAIAWCLKLLSQASVRKKGRYKLATWRHLELLSKNWCCSVLLRAARCSFGLNRCVSLRPSTRPWWNQQAQATCRADSCESASLRVVHHCTCFVIITCDRIYAVSTCCMFLYGCTVHKHSKTA